MNLDSRWKMKMLVALVILLAPAINGQDMPGSSCNLTIISDFPACFNSYLEFSLNSSVDDAAIDLICNNASCRTAITAYLNSCDNATDQQVSGMEKRFGLMFELSHVNVGLAGD